jgi:pimeloyl-ACP methyl ester carboxylesterase
MAPKNDKDVRAPDGRTLRIHQEGDPKGKPVFSLHGTPGGRLLYEKHVEDAQRRGLRLIGYDRPGYGGSTRNPGRRVVDAAADVKAIADDLGFDRFALWGLSGGGPHALAVAAKLNGRAVAVASLASPAPWDADGLDPFEGMGEANVEDAKLFLSDRAASEKKLRADADGLKQANADEVRQFLLTLLSDVDKVALTEQLNAFLRRQGQDGLTPTADGWFDDGVAGFEPWGFDLSEVRVPLQYWHGAHDKFVPFSHGQWLAAHLPRAEIHLEPNEGHLSLYENRIPEVQKWLSEHF